MADSNLKVCTFIFTAQIWLKGRLSSRHWLIFVVYFRRLLIAWNSTQWSTRLKDCTASRKVAGSIPDGVIGIFNWNKLSAAHCDAGVETTWNRNEYQVCLVGSKDDRCVGLTMLPASCADCLEFVSLGLLASAGIFLILLLSGLYNIHWLYLNVTHPRCDDYIKTNKYPSDTIKMCYTEPTATCFGF